MRISWNMNGISKNGRLMVNLFMLLPYGKQSKNHPKKISKNKKTMTPVSDVFLPLDRRWFKMMPYHVEAFQPVSIYIYMYI